MTAVRTHPLVARDTEDHALTKEVGDFSADRLHDDVVAQIRRCGRGVEQRHRPHRGRGGLRSEIGRGAGVHGVNRPGELWWAVLVKDGSTRATSTAVSMRSPMA
jgi:hypothetical protein